MPDKLIVFYGYENLHDSEFTLPSTYYLNYPSLTWGDVKSAIENGPVFTTNLTKRYPIYIYARQTGNWLRLLGIDETSQNESNLDTDISSSLGIFFAASYYDKDVNYQNSLRMSQKYGNSILFTSWQNKHEFDQLKSEESTQLYARLVNWL
jgi:hypothetical protein